MNTAKVEELLKMTEDGRALAFKVAKAQYDFSQHGGEIGDIPSGVFIPAKAVITKAWIDVLTTCQTEGSDAGTMAVKAASSGDLVAAVAVSNGGNPWDSGLKPCIPVGSAATMIKLTEKKEITFTIATQDFTAGKFNVFVEYVISE